MAKRLGRVEEQKLLGLYVEELVNCNAELDTLVCALEAFKGELITKAVLDHLTSPFPEVPVSVRRSHLLMHVQMSLQEKLENYSKHVNLLNFLTIANEAKREGLIMRDVVDHLAALRSVVPTEMSHRYLLMNIHDALNEKFEEFEARVSKVTFFQLAGYNSDPFQPARDAESIGLIEQGTVECLTSLYPSVPSRLKPLDEYIEMNTKLLNQAKIIELEISRSIKHHVNLPLSMNLSTYAPKPSKYLHLGLEQLSKLTEVLTKYAYSWRNIGVALNFQPQDLKNIQACSMLMHDSPRSYMTRLLEDWVLEKLEHTLPPTISNLKKALSSQTVGLGSVADELSVLGKNSLTTQAHHEINLPYSIITVLLTASKYSAYPVNDEIYLEENASTLLDIRITSNLEGGYKCKWLRDGIELAHNKPILCLHKADIDWDGISFACKVDGPGLGIDSLHIPITVHVSCPLDQFKGDLASMYLAQPEIPEDTWPPTTNQKYINLALIKQQKVNYGSEFARVTIRGDIDDILQEKQPYDYKDFVKSLKSGQLLIIQGRPGSGKTTFVHKIAQDWACSSEGAIRLLLLVSLRVLNTFDNPGLSEILKMFRDLRVSEELIVKRAGKGICFVFDGFDEFSPPNGKNSIVHKIINKTYLSQSTVIVASRPAAVAQLRHRAHKVIEVLGFLNDQILEYFDHYPFPSSSKSTELKAYLSLHPNVLHMCYLPIHTAMVAFLFQEMGKVPKTETEMYTHFTRFTLMRNLSKSEDFEPADIYLNRLPEKEQICFRQICHLAFDKTLSSKQVLHQDEVSSYFKIESQHMDASLGLITIDRTAGLYGFKNIYTFLHLTFQEYLAAYHISTLPDQEQLKILDEHGEKHHMLVVWKFFCGLTEIKVYENKFKSILSKTRERTLFQIQCAYESQQKLACVQTLKFIRYHIELEDQFLSTPDFTAMGYVTNTTLLPVRLSLINCNINIEAIDALLSEMEDKARQSVQSLHIQINSANSPQMAAIKKLLAKFQLLNGLFLEAEVMTEFRSFFEDPGHQFKNLTRLSLVNLNVDLGQLLHFNDSLFQNLLKLRYKGRNDGLKAIVTNLRHCQSLEELDLRGNNIDKDGVKLLAESLKNCGNLKVIHISNSNIPCSSIATILQSIKQCAVKIKASELTYVHNHGALLPSLEQLNHLQSLEISVEKKYFDQFCACTKSWKSLKELSVSFIATSYFDTCYFYFLSQLKELQALTLKYGIRNAQVAKSLADGLRQCPNLQKLDLSDNLISSAEIEVIATALFGFLDLTELHLNHNKLGDDGVKILSSCLQYYRNLQELSLASNEVGDCGGRELASHLYHCVKLRKLDLIDNNISKQSVHAISSCLKQCKDFQTLNFA